MGVLACTLRSLPPSPTTCAPSSVNANSSVPSHAAGKQYTSVHTNSACPNVCFHFLSAHRRPIYSAPQPLYPHTLCLCATRGVRYRRFVGPPSVVVLQVRPLPSCAISRVAKLRTWSFRTSDSERPASAPHVTCVRGSAVFRGLTKCPQACAQLKGHCARQRTLAEGSSSGTGSAS